MSSSLVGVGRRGRGGGGSGGNGPLGHGGERLVRALRQRDLVRTIKQHREVVEPVQEDDWLSIRD